MRLSVVIRCDNAAFHEDDSDGESEAARGAELARILRALADDVADGIEVGHSQALRDVNGNKVGLAEMTD